ncbi:cysteine desulfurase [Aurantimonas litoralis]|nr:cysteine desulfurase [Aurantimonas litoralis]
MDVIDTEYPAVSGATGDCRSPDSAIYLDHQASTPMDRRVIQRMVRSFVEDFGNPNNTAHGYGARSADALLRAAEDVAALVGAESRNVRFTSGASESIRLALRIALERNDGKKLRIASTRIEHDAVIENLTALVDQGKAEVRWIGVDGCARVDLSEMNDVLDGGIDLAVMMAANNEVGTVYPIEAIVRSAHAAGAEILVDATQAAGRERIAATEWGIDYLVFNAHKIYGPKGVGALITDHAHWTFARRIVVHPGTPDLPSAVGFAEACRIALAEGIEEERRVAGLRDRMQAILIEGVPGLVVNGDPDHRLSCNLHVSAPGVPGDAVLARLRNRVAISTGSACNSGAQETSHVLRAMRLPEDVQEGALRISLGRFTTASQADQAACWIAAAINDTRRDMTGHSS